MLTQLTLQNLALIEQAELDFHTGFNVITGETGAGKSLILDALQLCTGAKTDGSLIRHGQTQAEVFAEFDIRRLPAVQAWLVEQSHTTAEEIEDTLLIRRQLVDAGNSTIRSKIWLNGSPLSLNELKTLGHLLVNIHSQHAQHQLLRPQFILEWLDSATGLTQQAVQLKHAYLQYDKLKRTAKQQTQDAKLRDQQILLLNNQLADIEPILGVDYAQIEAEFDELSNAEALMQQAATSVNLLNTDSDEPDVLQLLGRAIKLCEPQTSISQTYADCVEQLYQAQSLVSDVASTLHEYADGQNLDPERLAELDSLLSIFHRLARKYHVSPDTLLATAESWQNELAELQDIASPEQLAEQIDTAYQTYLTLANALDANRQANAKHLTQTLLARLRTLALPNVQAEFSFIPLEAPTATGVSQVDLLFSANVGMPMQPLHKIASGGELSRLALVMQVIDAQGSCRNTLPENHNATASTSQLLVFDEVDVGISGGTAQVVGELLRELGQQQQILAITHQSQVAAMSHQHILVYKTQQDQAKTHISIIDNDEKIQELARMSGGVQITQATLDHAKSLLANVQQDPQTTQPAQITPSTPMKKSKK